jgi:hypothetical protein
MLQANQEKGQSGMNSKLKHGMLIVQGSCLFVYGQN